MFAVLIMGKCKDGCKKCFNFIKNIAPGIARKVSQLIASFYWIYDIIIFTSDIFGVSHFVFPWLCNIYHWICITCQRVSLLHDLCSSTWFAELANYFYFQSFFFFRVDLSSQAARVLFLPYWAAVIFGPATYIFSVLHIILSDRFRKIGIVIEVIVSSYCT